MNLKAKLLFDFITLGEETFRKKKIKEDSNHFTRASPYCYRDAQKKVRLNLHLPAGR